MDSSSLDFSGTRISHPALAEKYLALQERLRGLGEVLIGFSGGVDSTLLTAVARHVLGRAKVTACLAVGPSLAEQERLEAVELAALMDVELKTYRATEFENPAYVANGPDRCFHCKADLFQHLDRFAADSGSRAALLYGGNLDDTLDYRPGRKAAEAHGALAPLAEATLGKAEVRALSRAIGLPTSEKAAQPCLSSRIPYGSAVTPAKLAAVEAGEAMLAGMGFREFRLRHYGNLARIEVPGDQLDLFTAATKRDLAARLRDLGFTEMEIDPAGFRSGNLNRALAPDTLDRFSDRTHPGSRKVP
ncbi:MAG: ExsB family protein [Fibrobacteres bacterium]|nr:ExsB family protein [Fibrobacterota bacterium]